MIDQPLSDRARLMLVWPVAGFFVVIAFGVGLIADRGDTFRIRYMNEGLLIHPMHLHGLAQRVIAKDGHLLASPHWEDTVLVAPGERIDVLVKATEPGTWAFHCHILNHAESENGMFGMVRCSDAVAMTTASMSRFFTLLTVLRD